MLDARQADLHDPVVERRLKWQTSPSITERLVAEGLFHVWDESWSKRDQIWQVFHIYFTSDFACEIQLSRDARPLKPSRLSSTHASSAGVHAAT